MKRFSKLYFIIASLLTNVDLVWSVKRRRIQVGKGTRYQDFESNEDGRYDNIHEGTSNGLELTLTETELSPKEEETEGVIELGNGVFNNPCTGSISSDTIYNGDMFPCLQATNMPSTTSVPSMALFKAPKTTQMPTHFPSVSPRPSNYHSIMPSNTPSPSISSSPTVNLINISCPGYTHDCRSKTNDTVVVNFKYSVETTNKVQDPYTVLPKIEKTLLQYLAEKLLDHCTNSVAIRRKLLQVQDAIHGSKKGMKPRVNKNLHIYKKRTLQSQKYHITDILGICSFPEDVFIDDESCEPELNDQHNCFVIGGNVTVFVDYDAGTDRNEIVTVVQDKVKDAMVNDELLHDYNPEVKKVKYLDESDDNDSPNGASGDPPLSIVIGASLMALAGLLGFYLVKRQAKKFTSGSKLDDDAEEVMLSPNSFISPDSKDLAKISTLMNVHECKSAVCPKCYVDPRVSFIRTQPNPLIDKNVEAPLASRNSEDTVDGGNSSDGSIG